MRQWKKPLSRSRRKVPPALARYPPRAAEAGGGGSRPSPARRLRGGAARPVLQAAADTGSRSPSRGPRRRGRPGTCSLPSAPSRAGAPSRRAAGVEVRGAPPSPPQTRARPWPSLSGPRGGAGAAQGEGKGRGPPRAPPASPAAAPRPGAASPASPPPPCCRRPPPVTFTAAPTSAYRQRRPAPSQLPLTLGPRAVPDPSLPLAGLEGGPQGQRGRAGRGKGRRVCPGAVRAGGSVALHRGAGVRPVSGSSCCRRRRGTSALSGNPFCSDRRISFVASAAAWGPGRDGAAAQPALRRGKAGCGGTAAGAGQTTLVSVQSGKITHNEGYEESVEDPCGARTSSQDCLLSSTRKGKQR